jgi:hypothetical protein
MAWGMDSDLRWLAAGYSCCFSECGGCLPPAMPVPVAGRFASLADGQELNHAVQNSALRGGLDG